MNECLIYKYQRAIEILEKLAAINPCYNYNDYANKYHLRIKKIEEERKQKQ